MGTRKVESVPRRPTRARWPLRVLALVTAAAALAVGLGRPVPVRAQETGGAIKPVPEASRGGQEFRVERDRQRGVPPEIGQLLEVTEAARQSGVASVRYVRRVGNALYDWVDHLRISLAENRQGNIEYDRTNCKILYDLLRQSSPGVVIGEDIGNLRQQIGLKEKGDPITATLRLQLDIERYRFLYPLLDLRAMTDKVMGLLRTGQLTACDAALDEMLLVIALPNVDGPIQRSRAAYDSALAAYARHEVGEARRLLKDAANYATHLNVGTYLAESSWFLAKTDDALAKNLGGIALASVRDADTLLRYAEERAWKEFKPRISAVREESKRLVRVWSYLSSTDVRALAKRIDAELRIPS